MKKRENQGRNLIIALCLLPFLCSCENIKGTPHWREDSLAYDERIMEDTANMQVAAGLTQPLLNYDTIDNTKYEWWFQRNETHTQPEAQKNIDLSKYNAYYVGPDAGKKVIYLTFDCGYENGYTEQILDVLKKHKAKGTFFVLEHYIKDACELTKRMKKEGHYVGNHTCMHKDLTTLSVREIKLELKENEEIMKQYTGYDMDLFFRPPKGIYSEKVLAIAKDMGYTTIFWSLAYVDFDVNNQPGKQYVINHFNKYTHPGTIALIHNISRSNAEALDEVLTNLEKEGYIFGDMKKDLGKIDKKTSDK